MATFSIVGLLIQLVALIGMGIVAFLAWRKGKQKCTTDKDGKQKCTSGCNDKGNKLNLNLGIACIVVFVLTLMIMIGIIVVDLKAKKSPSYGGGLPMSEMMI